MNNRNPQKSSGYARCDSCGELIPLKSTFCPNCGSRKISFGSDEEEPLPIGAGTGYYASGFKPPVGQSSPYEEFTNTGYVTLGTSYPDEPYPDEPYPDEPYPDESYQDESYQDESYPDEPYADEPYTDRHYGDYGYEDDYFRSVRSDVNSGPDDFGSEEDDYYVPAAKPTASSVRITLAVLFVAAVFVVAFIGLLISFVPKSEASDEGKAASESHVSDVSSAPSSAESVRHSLPENDVNGKYKIFTIKDSKFGSVTASSFIDEKVTHGSSDRAFDGDPETCWQDGVSGYGVGEWILAFNADSKAVKVSSVTVYNGYQNPQYNTGAKDMYLYNSRVAAFELEFDDGSTESFLLEDSKDPQTFKFKSRETCCIRFTVKDVYKGKKYKDTCIGEIIYK